MSRVEQRAKQAAKQVLHGLGRASAEQAAVLERLARDVATLNARMDRVVEELRTELRHPGPGAPPPEPAPAFEHATPTFDDLYRSFEDRHRGTVEEIAARLRTDYLELLSTSGAADLPVVDLGCGRGELVDVLTAAGVTAVGVDRSPGQLAGADPAHRVEADLFEWLDARPDGSVRSVVATHVVEHLPADLQVRLVFEAWRVTAPGGVLVIEVPNPLSLTVGAGNFWVDPTHLRPVHPRLLEFLVEEAGFADVEVRPLHPTGVVLPAGEDAAPLAEALGELLYGSADVAVVARR